MKPYFLYLIIVPLIADPRTLTEPNTHEWQGASIWHLTVKTSKLLFFMHPYHHYMYQLSSPKIMLNTFHDQS